MKLLVVAVSWEVAQPQLGICEMQFYLLRSRRFLAPALCSSETGEGKKNPWEKKF